MKEAKALIRKPSYLGSFLSFKLNYSWTEVHAEAEKLEHASSDELIDHMDEYLGYPKYCNHGNPIPQKDGSIEVQYNDAWIPLKRKNIYFKTCG